MEVDEAKVKDNAELALRCITNHCMWCADCDWENNPDPTCGCFAEFWLKIRKEKEDVQTRTV